VFLLPFREEFLLQFLGVCFYRGGDCELFTKNLCLLEDDPSQKTGARLLLGANYSDEQASEFDIKIHCKTCIPGGLEVVYRRWPVLASEA